VADIGGHVAENRFKWIFVLNGHGGPHHNTAISEACDFVSETFKVTMLHVTALFRADAAIQSKGKKINEKHFSPAELASFGMDVHAGVGETSGILAIRPDLVDASYQALPNQVGKNFSELREIASQPGWQGYLSSPAKANAAYGRAFEEWWVDGFTDLILRAIHGQNMFKQPSVPETDFGNTAVEEVLTTAIENERAFEQKLANWLARRKNK
jgi:creatinine amidohydrolase/Fe(II)-dependent formamide hydrolase-like protein